MEARSVRRESGNSARSGESRSPLISFARRDRPAQDDTDGAPLPQQSLSTPRTSLAYRRHRSLWAGLLTLLIGGYSAFVLFEAIWGIASRGDDGRGVVRWIQVVIGLIAAAVCMLVVLWLQTRRPSTFSVAALLASLLVFFLHLAYAFTNLILALVWRQDLSQRCSWSIDAAWTLGNAGENCGPDGGIGIAGWAIAGGLRLLFTLIIGSIWFLSLRTFYRALSSSLPLLVETQMTEAQTLLSSRQPDALLPMPEISNHYAFTSEISTAVSTHSRLEEAAASGGVGGWLASGLLGAVGWLFGLDPYPGKVSQGKRKGSEEARSLRKGWGSEGLPGQRNTAGTLREEDEDDWEIVGSFGDSMRQVVLPERTIAEEPPFKLLSKNPETTSNSYPSSSSSAAATTSSHVFAPTPYRPPRSSTGSSGSTNGALVFVRMSDGRLVRKLSTIASEVSDREGSTASTSFASEHMLASSFRGGEIREVGGDVGRWRESWNNGAGQ